MTSLPLYSTFTITIMVLSMSDFAYTTRSRYTFDLEIRYFTNGNLICDHPELNITKRNDVDSLYWIFEDGSLVTPDTPLDPKLYLLQGLPDGVTGDSQPQSNYNGYNLTALEVNDDVFGYYTCIILFRGESPRVAAIQYGLNVDGADFSELLDEYRNNAIVGGIAAGVVLVLIGVACFVWYYWCYEKIPDGLEEEGVLQELDAGLNGSGKDKDGDVAYHNEAYSTDKTNIEDGSNVRENLNETARL